MESASSREPAANRSQRINDHELEQLPGRSYAFRAKIDGKFPEYSYPTDEVLELFLVYFADSLKDSCYAEMTE